MSLKNKLQALTPQEVQDTYAPIGDQMTAAGQPPLDVHMRAFVHLREHYPSLNQLASDIYETQLDMYSSREDATGDEAEIAYRALLVGFFALTQIGENQELRTRLGLNENE